MFTPGLRPYGYKIASGRHEWPNRDPIQELGGLNLYNYVGNDPINFYDPFGLYTWETQWWADLSVNGNLAQRVTADILGPFAAALPDTGGASLNGTAGVGAVGSAGLANMSFWAKDPNDPCHGHNATYTTTGLGIGTPQIGITDGLSLGWADFENPTAQDYTGDFTEDNVSFLFISVTLWSGSAGSKGSWSGITVGLTGSEPPASASIQTVNYQFYP